MRVLLIAALMLGGCAARTTTPVMLARRRPLVLVTTTIPDGIVGVPYSAQLVASGGKPPYHWTLTSPLPDGLTLDPNTGIISGTPTVATVTQLITIHPAVGQ